MRAIAGLLILIMVAPMLSASDDEQERLESSATVLEEILNIPDALPKELLNKAECVVVLPSVKNFAFGIGGSYGRGRPGLPHRQSISPVPGAPRPCIGWREQASASSWVGRPRTSFFWS